MTSGTFYVFTFEKSKIIQLATDDLTLHTTQNLITLVKKSNLLNCKLKHKYMLEFIVKRLEKLKN